MNVLGIIAFGQNPAACLVSDGRVRAFVEEERLNRYKGSTGFFPALASRHCLDSNGLKLSDIDAIAFGWDCTKYPLQMAGSMVMQGLRTRGLGGGGGGNWALAADTLLRYHPDRVREGIRDGLHGAGLKGKIPEVHFVPHHQAHAYSTYFASGFPDAAILTLDGSGEAVSTQISVGRGDDVRVVESVPIPHSLGWFFAAVTEYLGFNAYRDEGKVMGLAAYGEARRDTNPWVEPLSRVLQIRADGYSVDPRYTKLGAHSHGARFSDELVALLQTVDRDIAPVAYGEKDANGTSKYLQERYIDLAWAAQHLLEQAAIVMARRALAASGSKNLCVAGGVASNCKLNGQLLRQSGCTSIFASPVANDSGTALGAAMVVAKDRGMKVGDHWQHAYYGPAYGNEEVRMVLERSGVRFRATDDPGGEAARLLGEGKTVGWFSGRAEIGSRALGARSILSGTSRPAREKINARVKLRESWRPFCPSMTEKGRTRFVKDPNEASFMVVAYHATEECAREHPAIVHIDGTIRPQVIVREANPTFHDAIARYGERNGGDIVLNTSFNLRGEPIVTTPLDALRCYAASGMDALVMESFVVEKPAAS